MTPVEATVHWLQEVVVAENFCPFARKPLAEGNVLVEEVRGFSDEEILLKVHTRLTSFKQAGTHETVLFVLPKGYDDFRDYLEIVDTFELLLEHEFDCELSLATFHPAHQFAEFAPSDVVHHIHRSPYPILHVLREESVDKVREGMEDTLHITKRNHDHAKKLGKTFFESFLPRH